LGSGGDVVIRFRAGGDGLWSARDYFHSLKRRDVYAAVMDRFHNAQQRTRTDACKNMTMSNSPARSLAAKVRLPCWIPAGLRASKANQGFAA